MLTEALKCEIEILDKMTDARIMKWWFDYIPNESKYMLVFFESSPHWFIITLRNEIESSITLLSFLF